MKKIKPPIQIVPNPIEPIVTPYPFCTSLCNVILFWVIMIILFVLIPSLIKGHWVIPFG